MTMRDALAHHHIGPVGAVLRQPALVADLQTRRDADVAAGTGRAALRGQDQKEVDAAATGYLPPYRCDECDPALPPHVEDDTCVKCRHFAEHIDTARVGGGGDA
ncbi:hypothetical protein CspHIS471_0401750 [Cutaneotrichosporon sp. HIS471]|nr:hypothetical protein CspHIS471_0401750 [Cutaneotrichosporon sp. HIS471]